MALTFSEATSALLGERWDVVIIGALFDESRALELMALLGSDEAISRAPIVGIRGAKIARKLPPEVFDFPMKQLGAVDVIDFSAVPDDAGGNAEIGVRIRAAAAGCNAVPYSAWRPSGTFLLWAVYAAYSLHPWFLRYVPAHRETRRLPHRKRRGDLAFPRALPRVAPG